MSEPMLERVARAIGGKLRVGGLCPSGYVAGVEEAAKAALEALMEPDEAMLRAFYEATCPPGDAPAGGFTRWATWDEAKQFRGPEIKRGLVAMLKVALNEPAPTMTITQELGPDGEVREL